MNKRTTIAKTIAYDAGQVLLRGFRKTLTIQHKGAVDLVTNMDLKSEKMIHTAIRKHFPDDSILAEESGSEETGSRYRWIVDPLDGTTNYAHGYPVWCVSIAIELDREIVGGVIYNPNLDEMFYAQRGRGAFRNQRRIHVSMQSKLADSLLATGFPYDIGTSKVDNLKHFGRLYKLSRGVRRGGSAAMDIAYTAAGIFDGFWELKLSPWDTAAGKIIAEEAGAKITDFAGNAYDIFEKEIVCANRKLLKQILRILQL
ncbi:MAG: inositol monophosphatase [candidate division Zixibacteria bacterium]|nr:inositol monophosphatase [candidate division Zixibacteria bacterium]MBU1470267.1 inositol monophosphatase [candidate division Zixibacteria bacterium]MBU2626415.1 inositol monophosphatase [candidate division Zixibacteria bacterium]